MLAAKHGARKTLYSIKKGRLWIYQRRMETVRIRIHQTKVEQKPFAIKPKVPALVDALVGAAKAGELDELMARMGKPVGAPKARRAA